MVNKICWDSNYQGGERVDQFLLFNQSHISTRLHCILFIWQYEWTMQLLTTIEKLKFGVSTSVDGWSKETEYFRYLQGLLQLVIFRMSSYRKRKRLSFKSSINLKRDRNQMRKVSFPPVLLAIITKGCALVTPVAPLGSTPNLKNHEMVEN